MITLPPPAAVSRMVCGELLFNVVRRAVPAVAVGAFHKENVEVAQDVRILDHRHVGPADIAGKAESHHAAVLCDFERRAGRAENVAGVPKRHAHAGNRRKRLIVRNGPEFVHARLGILDRVERFEGGVVLPALLCIGKFEVLELKVGRIPQHDAAQFHRGRRGVDRAGKSPLDKVRNVSAVVDMGMRQDEAVELLRVKGEIEVPLVRFAAPALKQTAFDAYRMAVYRKNMQRSGDGAGASITVKLHANGPSKMSTGGWSRPPSQGTFRKSGLHRSGGCNLKIRISAFQLYYHIDGKQH